VFPATPAAKANVRGYASSERAGHGARIPLRREILFNPLYLPAASSHRFRRADRSPALTGSWPHPVRRPVRGLGALRRVSVSDTRPPTRQAAMAATGAESAGPTWPSGSSQATVVADAPLRTQRPQGPSHDVRRLTRVVTREARRSQRGRRNPRQKTRSPGAVTFPRGARRSGDIAST
jgi:hypothetical protein